MKRKMITICLAVSAAAAFVLFAVLAEVFPLQNEKTADVFRDTVRLRVIANSDSEADQQLKYEVRNDVLALAKEVFAGCKSREEAENAVEEHRDEWRKAAEESVKMHGADYPVTVTFGKETCPVRRYSAFTFPAGEYLTLRFCIGEAQGKNWWCVLYPPLCVNTAVNEVYADCETFLAYGFDKKQVEELMADGHADKPQVRSALADWVRGLFSA